MSVLAQFNFGSASPSSVLSGLTSSAVTHNSLPTFSANSNVGYSTSPELLVGAKSGATSAATAVSTGSYFYITLTPDSGKKISFSSLTFKAARGGSSTPRGWVLRTSVDSYAADVATGVLTTQRTTWSNFSVGMSAGGFQNLTSAITFRIYIYSPAGTFIDFDDIAFNGTVADIATTFPDLQVTDITWSPASPVVGNAITFSADIINNGNAATPGSTVHGVRFDVNGSQVAVSTSRTTSIASGGGTATVQADATWTPVTNGTFDVVATVDYDNLINNESNETNNTRTESIVIGAAATNITSFNGRSGPAIAPIQADYDEFFLTPGEGATEGMPAIESTTMDTAGALSNPLVVITGGLNTGWLLSAVTEARWNYQWIKNDTTSAKTVAPPSGYSISGSAVIEPGTTGLFIKRGGSLTFDRA